MRVTGVVLHRVHLPLVTPFRSAHGVETVRDALLVRVDTPDGAGWGECVAMSDPTYTSEYVDGAQQVMAGWLAPLLLSAGELGGADVAGVLSPVKGHPMAKAALELAVLDAELRQRQQSLAAFFGAQRERVLVGVAVGISGSVDALVDAVAAHVAAGYRRVKLKIEPGWDVAPVAAVRDTFGDDLMVQVDANGSYAEVGGEALFALDDFGLLLIEQPLDDDDLAGHAKLATRLRTPICLDESITSARRAAEAVAMGACSIVNIKPGRVGGYIEAKRIHDDCLAAGVATWIGGMLETGIGRAANLALAGLPGCTLPGDISASNRYYATDVTPAFVLEDGALTVPSAPGIGVDVLTDVIDELTTARVTIA
jgi:O-succinylbenzoate synthase